MSDQPPPEKQRPRARLTVVEYVYHQMVDSDPTSADSRYAVQLESDEQPYVRTTKATAEWRTVDCGWIERASLLVVKNLEPAGGPTLEIATDGQTSPLWIVPPGESFRGRPADARSLLIRSQPTPARYTLTLFPG